MGAGRGEAEKRSGSLVRVEWRQDAKSPSKRVPVNRWLAECNAREAAASPSLVPCPLDLLGKQGVRHTRKPRPIYLVRLTPCSVGGWQESRDTAKPGPENLLTLDSWIATGNVRQPLFGFLEHDQDARRSPHRARKTCCALRLASSQAHEWGRKRKQPPPPSGLWASSTG